MRQPAVCTSWGAVTVYITQVDHLCIIINFLKQHVFHEELNLYFYGGYIQWDANAEHWNDTGVHV